MNQPDPNKHLETITLPCGRKEYQHLFDFFHGIEQTEIPNMNDIIPNKPMDNINSFDLTDELNFF